jgi:adenine-specific DNA methylase
VNFKRHESAQKLRGGYYTPPDLAEFLVRWVNEIAPRHILEPSCGNGVFFTAMQTMGRWQRSEIVAFELDRNEASKARRTLAAAAIRGTVKDEDFLGWAAARIAKKDQTFDAVIGNPPFVRYQYLPPKFQDRSARVFALLDCGFTKHTNAWVPFVLASLALLRPGGRLAMVVPAEIIHVMHAQSLRAYLGRECRRLAIVDPEELWFADTLQGAVLLLAEKRRDRADQAKGVGIYPVHDREFLARSPAEVFAAPSLINGKTAEGKWTRALLDSRARSLLDALEQETHVHRFADVATVDVGIVTGANNFFLVDDETVERFKLRRWAHPMFGRSEHCPGIIYDRAQHRANAKAGHPTSFLWLDEDAERDPSVRAYIRSGEREELHTRYKCRIRKPWYTVPSVYATEIGMLKRSHHMPRLILNRAGAYTTDTAYRIRSRVDTGHLVGSFINPLTALSAELEGRHYGGGVLELVPSEIERVLIPLASIKLDVTALDAAVRSGPMDDLVEANGATILGSLGLSKADVHLLMSSWAKLRNRRQRTNSLSLTPP